MYCKNCGALVEDGSKFCPSCGKPIGEKTKGGKDIKKTLVIATIILDAVLLISFLLPWYGISVNKLKKLTVDELTEDYGELVGGMASQYVDGALLLTGYYNMNDNFFASLPVGSEVASPGFLALISLVLFNTVSRLTFSS